MRISFKSLLLLLAAAAFFYGCDKKKKKTDDANSWGVFENQTNAELTANVYKTYEDYNAGTNLYKTFRVPANSSYTLSETGMAPRTLYYVDYYSDDFTLTNWPSYNASPQDKSNVLHMGADSASYFPMKANPQTARKVLLGDKATVVWIPVDAYTYNYISNVLTPVWNTLPEATKNFDIEMNKQLFKWRYYQSGTMTGHTMYQVTDAYAKQVGSTFYFSAQNLYIYNATEPVADVLDCLNEIDTKDHGSSNDTIRVDNRSGIIFKMVRK